VVENRPGASGTVGTGSVARSRPDGYTMLFGTNSTYAIAPHLMEGLPYDNATAFAGISLVGRTAQAFCVHPSVPATTLAEFLALARGQPGQLTFSSAGNGATSHLATELLMARADISLLHVPYRGGALALNDVVAGHLSLAFMSQSTAGSQLAAGKVRVLGVYGEKRVSSIPDIPTFREQGLDTRIADQGVWFGIATTAGTPRDIVAKLNKVVNDALKDPTTKAALEKADYNLTGGTPEDLKALIDEHTVYWKGALAKAGIKPEEAK